MVEADWRAPRRVGAAAAAFGGSHPSRHPPNGCSRFYVGGGGHWSGNDPRAGGVDVWASPPAIIPSFTCKTLTEAKPEIMLIAPADYGAQQGRRDTNISRWNSRNSGMRVPAGSQWASLRVGSDWHFSPPGPSCQGVRSPRENSSSRFQRVSRAKPKARFAPALAPGPIPSSSDTSQS